MYLEQVCFFVNVDLFSTFAPLSGDQTSDNQAQLYH